MAYITMDSNAFPDSFPEDISQVLESTQWQLWHPDDSNEEMEPYQHAIRGRCMFCGDSMHSDSVAMVSSDGIIGVWCSGTCLQHMIAVSFLEDIQQGILVQRER